MRFQNSRRLQGDVRWKHWLICSVSGLSVMHCVIWLLFLLMCLHLCMCVAHAHIIPLCVLCIWSVLTTDMRHLSSPLSLQMPAGGTRLYCFIEMSVHSVCVWHPEMLEGNLIIYRFIVVLRWIPFSDPTHRKNPNLLVFMHVFIHDVYVFAWEMSHCKSLYLRVLKLVWVECLWMRQCMTALTVCFSTIHHSLSNKCFR